MNAISRRSDMGNSRDGDECRAGVTGVSGQSLPGRGEAGAKVMPGQTVAAGPGSVPSAAMYDEMQAALEVFGFLGLNDSPAADAIRDAMTPHWPAKLAADKAGPLTPEEQLAFGVLDAEFREFVAQGRMVPAGNMILVAIRAAVAEREAEWVRLARDHCVRCCEQIVQRADLGAVQPMVSRATAEAVAEEREACAKEADGFADEIAGPMDADARRASRYVLLKQAERIAERIRARGES